jgi:hypothetical protein
MQMQGSFFVIVVQAATTAPTALARIGATASWRE